MTDPSSTSRSTSLTPTAHAILGYLASHPRSGYEIRRASERTPFWGVSDGQLYPQLRTLEAEGLIAVEPGGSDARGTRVWRLVDAGMRALRSWLRSPSAPVATRDENMAKLLFAARSDHAAAAALVEERRRQFTAFRAHLLDLTPAESWTDEERASAAGVPELIRVFGIEYCDLNLGWCDRVDAALAAAPAASAEEHRG
ncbi:PadR family transcriptional regulator [Sphingomonas sp. BLCC-B65]|nr:PadR family transcriptional regulator [Sphingomonas sp. BLCC-B65]